MAEYYVIRDKNTGLYFRGKGVNRWGKHYNQASIYRVKGSAEHTIKGISWHGEKAEIVPIQIVETTADVAEVCRCKDCKYSREDKELCDMYGCTLYRDMRKGGDFCNYGERKEQE